MLYDGFHQRQQPALPYDLAVSRLGQAPCLAACVAAVLAPDPAR
jgi:hypothetical protein